MFKLFYKKVFEIIQSLFPLLIAYRSKGYGYNIFYTGSTGFTLLE